MSTAGAVGVAARRPPLDIVALLATLLAAVPLLVFHLWPVIEMLGRSFATPDGLGLANYSRMLGNFRFLRLLGNSLAVTLLSAAIAVIAAYAYAYALQRTFIPAKGLWRIVALLPLFAPSLVQAQGLVLLLGRNGLINRSFELGIDIYGFWGIVIASTIYVFPYAFLILSTALAVADARTYESAEMLGAGPWRVFRTVTLPATRYGLMAAGFVCFTLVITDFGNPTVIGGDYSVLATEIYNQVIGQANFELGTVIGVVLLIPAAAAAIADKWIGRRQFALVSDQSRPLEIRPAPGRDAAFLVVVLVCAGAILSIIGIVCYASVVHLWPYRLDLSLRHFAFDVQNGTDPLWNSVFIGLLAAVLGTMVVMAAAYVTERLRSPLTRLLYFLAILPAAVPGLVLGLGYLLAFNDPANPLSGLYGTLMILALVNVFYYHAQGFLIASTAVRQISAAFDEASAMLGASRWRTFRRITLPMVAPSLVGIGVFFFMRSMVTLSAVIFLITPATQVAAVSVLLLEERGATNQAAAFSVSIMAIVLGFLLLARLALNLAGLRQVTLIR